MQTRTPDQLAALTRWLFDRLHAGISFQTHETCPVHRVFPVQSLSLRISGGVPILTCDLGPFLLPIVSIWRPGTAPSMDGLRHVSTTSAAAVGGQDHSGAEFAVTPATQDELAAWTAWAPRPLSNMALPIDVLDWPRCPPTIRLETIPDGDALVHRHDAAWTTGIFPNLDAGARTRLRHHPENTWDPGFGTVIRHALPASMRPVIEGLCAPDSLARIEPGHDSQHGRMQHLADMLAFNTVLAAAGFDPVPEDLCAIVWRQGQTTILGAEGLHHGEAGDAVWPICTLVDTSI